MLGLLRQAEHNFPTFLCVFFLMYNISIKKSHYARTLGTDLTWLLYQKNTNFLLFQVDVFVKMPLGVLCLQKFCKLFMTFVSLLMYTITNIFMYKTTKKYRLRAVSVLAPYISSLRVDRINKINYSCLALVNVTESTLKDVWGNELKKTDRMSCGQHRSGYKN